MEGEEVVPSFFVDFAILLKADGSDRQGKQGEGTIAVATINSEVNRLSTEALQDKRPYC